MKKRIKMVLALDLKKAFAPALVLLAVFLCAPLALAAGPKGAASKLVIKKGDLVTLDYTLRVDGKVVDSTKGKRPFQFTAGMHEVVPGFDKAVMGMRTGQKKVFTIPPKEGYGVRDPKNISEVPRSQVPANVKPGMVLYQQDFRGRRPVRVLTVKKDTVVLDFNPPLAGKTLHFSIRIVDVKRP
ncbi:MAG: peptidylprolyl isomerase [Nitrospiraceae bacterium]|nr:peptidylprolyl isomerase [Nitrospiraceae bacterium]